MRTGVRTLRGQLPNGTVRRLVVDDGEFTHAYRILEFYAFPARPDNAGEDVAATLALNEQGARITWDAANGSQIGWAATGIGGSRDLQGTFSLIDPDHIVVRDLWIYGSGSAAAPTNYLIVLEPVTISEDRAVLALIKERQQDDI
jgi:hypothetical protein